VGSSQDSETQPRTSFRQETSRWPRRNSLVRSRT
jgi:hypothetical protein